MSQKILAMSLLKIAPKRFGEVIEKLRKVPQICRITLLTGEFDAILEIRIGNMEELYDLFSEKIDPIEGILDINTHVVMKEFRTDMSESI